MRWNHGNALDQFGRRFWFQIRELAEVLIAS